MYELLQMVGERGAAKSMRRRQSLRRGREVCGAGGEYAARAGSVRRGRGVCVAGGEFAARAGSVLRG